jgi:hypothetical protein
MSRCPPMPFQRKTTKLIDGIATTADAGLKACCTAQYLHCSLRPLAAAPRTPLPLLSSAEQSHGGADTSSDRSALARVASDGAPDRADHRSSYGAACYLAALLGRLRGLNAGCRIESGLLLRPAMTFTFVFGLLLKALPLARIDDGSLALSQGGSCKKKVRSHRAYEGQRRVAENPEPARRSVLMR